VAVVIALLRSLLAKGAVGLGISGATADSSVNRCRVKLGWIVGTFSVDPGLLGP
jgi:hypothetical protein